MTFLNPLILLGLAAAAIPLIIHLFNFRRPKRVDFSSLTFVKELQKTAMRRVQIKQWLLLLIRTLAIACLVLAFARPTVQGDWASLFGQRAGSSVAIVMDNSLAMSLRDSRGEYLTQARQIAASVIDQMAPGDELFIVPTAEVSAARSAAFRNRASAQEALGHINVLAGASSIQEGIRRAGALLQNASNINKEIYAVSALQKSQFEDGNAVDLPDEVRVILLPVGTRSHSNIAVTNVRVLSHIIEAGQPVRMEATLANFSPDDVENYMASVFLEEERIAQASANIPSGGEITVEFSVTPQARGWLSGRVELEDDAFPYDNIRYFTLHVPESRNLLLVAGQGQRTDFLNLALSPELTRGRVTFSVHTISETHLAGTALADYDAVILAGVRNYSSGAIASLARYISEGGGVLFFPSQAASPSDYNALFEQVGGGTFSGFTGSPGPGPVVTTFERVDLDHQLFEGMLDDSGGRRAPARVESPDIFLAMNYRPASPSEHTLIEQSNGFPFLHEIRHGQGSMLVASVAPDEEWSDLPVRGLFVPLLYRSVYFLASKDIGTGERLTVGHEGSVRVAGVLQTELLHLVGPDGEELTPEQRNTFGATLLQIPGTYRMPGVYDVVLGDRIVQRVPLNIDPAESNLEALSTNQAEAVLAEATGREIRSIDLRGESDLREVTQAIHEDRFGVELWNVFLAFALSFLILEMLVAMQWKPEAVAAA